jgi:hypothetical protein
MLDLYRPDGHVLVIGTGRKTRKYLDVLGWEENALLDASRRFPGRRIVYRPKPLGLKIRQTAKPDPVEWEYRSENTSINSALKGASLVICRHSNVAVDACMAGIPVECSGGAAHWLYSRVPIPTMQERLDFLYRLAWWQWRFFEMKSAWQFLVKKAAELRLNSQPVS